MSVRPTTSSDAVGAGNYEDGAGNLEARAALWSYAVGTRGTPDWFLDIVPWTGDELALDVGTGSGRFLAALRRRAARVVGFDLQPAMLRDAAANAAGSPLVAADVAALPVPDGTADVVLAAWMLYHAPDVDRAVAELARSTKPGGPVIAVTNALAHTAELDDLGREATRRLLGDDAGWHWPSVGFTADAAIATLCRHLDDVVAHPRRVLLRVPDAAPVVAYLASIRHIVDAGLAAHGATFDDLAPHLAAVADEQIAATGAVEVTGLPVALVGRAPAH